MPENRLIHEKSPYLLQHAHNPVDWFPWGNAAFKEARQSDKPVFLSIGYSTCHWCHVMERESFEDEEAAALLNRAFVCIKVDREERPDVDAVYMSVCQALTGSGGWPLTILMTPDQKPFWAGTYLPKHTRYGQPGLMELLRRVETLWRTDRESLLDAGEKITAHISQQAVTAADRSDRQLLHSAANLFRHSFDRKNGGFGDAPKFPVPHNLLFLMEYARLENDRGALHMAETTLTQMARGGLFDQVGGGFSRYSTDKAWLAPHFEKMLYDNALLSYAYLEAYERTGREFYRNVAQRTMDYVLRELTGPSGEFFCGQDADSEGEEGKFYLLTPQEIQRILGPDSRIFCDWYGIAKPGNFEGKSIPNLLDNAGYEKEPPQISTLRKKIWMYRRSRAELHRDDKVLTAWNALMIAALAKAFRVLGKAEYLQAALLANAFIHAHLTTPDGCLWLRWREGEAAHAGQLDDYAFYTWALLELYAADYDVSHLREAIQLASEMKKRFWDDKHGGFYLTADDSEQLIYRPKETYDGAMPSGNAAAGLVLVRLWKLTGEQGWRELADRQMAFLAGCSREYPSGHSFALIAFCQALYPSRELVCVTAGEIPAGLHELVERKQFITLLKTPASAPVLKKIAPFSAAYPFPKKGAAFYLCQNGACSAPVFDISSLG